MPTSATVLLRVTAAPPESGERDRDWHAHADFLPGRRVIDYHVWDRALRDEERARLELQPPSVADCDCLICIRRRRTR